MDFLNVLDIHFLLSMTVMLTIFVMFYYSATRRQKVAMIKMELSLKHQEQAIHQNNLMLSELRRANRYLGELAGIELAPSAADEIIAPRSSSMNNTMNPDTSGANSPYKLYVGNIDYAATEAELADHFIRYGQVEFVNIPVNRYTGRARGFGFVTFSSKEDAERAMDLNGSEFRGRQIQVNFAKERETA